MDPTAIILVSILTGLFVFIPLLSGKIKTFSSIKRLAENGDEEARLDAIEWVYKAADGGRDIPKNNEDWIRKMADQGCAKAQTVLGHMLDSQWNKHEAAKWWLKAAEQGDSLAQYALGIYYTNNILHKDNKPEEAAKWYEKAAEQGDFLSQVNLAGLYAKGSLYGSGVDRDLVKAYMWYKIAYKHRFEDKAGNIIKEWMSETEIRLAEELSREWKPKKKK